MRQQDPLQLAKQTYTYLRLGMLAVIVGLAIAIVREVIDSDGCIQRSISAYYYTPVRSVFVGGLIALALALVAMWGRNPAEDAFLNLAGLFAPVVAFVPTSDANYCSVSAAGGDRAAELGTEKAEETTAVPVVDAAQAAVDNNMFTFALLVAAGIAFLLWRNLRTTENRQALKQSSGWAYALTYVLAIVALIVGVVTFLAWPDTFYDKAHFTAAVLMFACINVVVFACSYELLEDRVRGTGGESARQFFSRLPSRLVACWGNGYGKLAYAMIAAAIIIVVAGKVTGWDHWVLVIEATLTALFFIFWAAQTRGDKDMVPRPDPVGVVGGRASPDDPEGAAES